MQELNTVELKVIAVSFDDKLIAASLEKMRLRANEGSEQKESSQSLIYNSYRATRGH